jgi:hypothetical protein
LTNRSLLVFATLLFGCKAADDPVDYIEHGAHPIKVTSITEGIQAFSLDDNFVLGKLTDDQLVNAIIIMDIAKEQVFDAPTLASHSIQRICF